MEWGYSYLTNPLEDIKMSESIKANGLSLCERRVLLKDYLIKGLIGNVVWVKKDGVVADRNVKLWKESALASGTREFVQENPAKHKEELFTCYEVNDKWCNISLDKLVSAKLGGVLYEFEVNNVN